MFASKDIFLKSSGGGYQISRSVRLRSSASAYFNRTPANAGNRTVWTYSTWVKRGSLNTYQALLDVYIDTVNASVIDFTDTNNIRITNVVGGSTFTNKITSAVYRDPSAWYHIVVSCNSSSSLNLYVNGVQVTNWGTNTGPTADNWFFNSTNAHWIGREQFSTTNYYTDGYLTEINFVDGQALTPSSFGETNAVTGVWQPKAYSGTYGTNGFYLNFSDNSTAAALGTDFSGNSNTWTTNNISVTAGVTYDSMLDVPTPYADGGNGRGNYCVLNPLDKETNLTFTNGNLTATGYNAGGGATIQPTSGKYYWEVTLLDAYTPTTAWGFFGLSTGAPSGYVPGFTGTVGAGVYAINSAQGGTYANGTLITASSSFATNDVLGFAYDATNLTLDVYKNNTQIGTTLTGSSAARVITTYQNGTVGDTSQTGWNFGQRPFSYTPPTGFVALNTQNLPTPTISDGASYMAATTYTGTGSALTIANTVGSASFQPDFVWVKGRSGATDHALYDAVRNVQNQLESNSTGAETTETTGLTAFGSTGFTVGALAQMNTNTATYVAWQWNAGGSTVTNTSGSISAQVRANATAGFSVVTYTGTGVAATVGHGLGVKPSMIILKNRSGVYDWPTWSQYLPNPTTQHFWLNATNAAQTSSSFNSTQPTSSVFNIGTTSEANGNTNNFVAYCFAAVAGYSAFGSYTGNGSADGPFVFLGFRPRFVMLKRTDVANDWAILDTARNTFNVTTQVLFPNSSVVEGTQTTPMDILSNGFKVRNGADNYINASGGTYVYACFAENPFKLSLAR